MCLEVCLTSSWMHRTPIHGVAMFRCPHPNALAALQWIYENKGVQGLWRGTSAGIMKTVPK